MAIARATGLVLNVTARTGTSKAGNSYDRTAVDLLVAGRGMLTVDDSTDNWRERVGRVPRRSEVVDYVVDLDVYNGALTVRPVSEYSDDDAAAALAAISA